LLSGIMAASLSGWVFALFCGLGLLAGWWLRNAAPRSWFEPVLCPGKKGV